MNENQLSNLNIGAYYKVKIKGEEQIQATKLTIEKGND